MGDKASDREAVSSFGVVDALESDRHFVMRTPFTSPGQMHFSKFTFPVWFIAFEIHSHLSPTLCIYRELH